MKQDQVLQIEPQNELRFKGPFNEPVTSYMKLTNPSDKRVLFKIKTTAPRKYCVRPNSGILEPFNSAEIAISLQPFVLDPTEKNKHKFMVQTVFAPEGDINLEQLWKQISPEQMMDSKLRCVFELPPEPDSDAAGVVANQTAEVPKQGGASAAGQNISAELQKKQQEYEQLKEEESQLRQDNLHLKEEILLLKHQLSISSRSPPTNRYAPPIQQQQIPMAYIALAVILGFIGIILGKFAL